jgi:TRAP transporter 4TM/12TM fusion protein
MSENIDAQDKGFGSIRNNLILTFGLILTLFHLYTAGFGILTGHMQAPIHWSLVGAVMILARPTKIRGGMIIDAVLVILIVYISIHNTFLRDRLIFRPNIYTTLDIVSSVCAVLIALYLGFKVLGPVLPSICIVFIMYAYFGNNIPGLFATANFSAKRIVTYLYVMNDGLYGQTLLVSAQFLLLFMFFGSLMDVTGSGEFFVDIANSVAGRVRGGPAQSAVFSSMLMGMVNGSGAANVATTGTFTIPLMKKTGYKPSVAGAVEAVASSGGQFMPPVMGASAFLMSETTGIPYSMIALSAFAPACLYYIALSISVYGFARKDKMEKPEPSSLPSFFATLKKGWYYLVPLCIIVRFVFGGYSAQRSVFYAIISSFVICLIFNRKQVTPSRLLRACRHAAISCGPLALCCMLAGVIMGMINLTGLGLKVSSIIAFIAGNHILSTLLLAMVTSLILGMGMPTSAAYVVLSVLVAPSIIGVGASVMAAHLFILYFGALSSITPPVALSTYTAAGISGAGLWETGFEAMKLAAAGFIVPFIFAYSPELLLAGEMGDIVSAIVTAAIGCSLLGFIASGWCGINLTVPIRILLAPCSVMLIIADHMVSIAGFVLASLLMAVNYFYNKRISSNLGS